VTLLTIPVLLAILEALKAFFTFLCTEEGQKISKQWGDDNKKLREDLAAGWKQIEGLFRSGGGGQT
jgi:hypothetical protein